MAPEAENFHFSLPSAREMAWRSPFIVATNSVSPTTTGVAQTPPSNVFGFSQPAAGVPSLFFQP